MKEKTNLTMLCDFYELTMGNGYFQTGLGERICYFDVFFRSVPDQGGFAIAAGLAQVIEYIQKLRFDEEDIAYLRSKGCFAEPFLDYLRQFRFTGDIWAVPEGTPIFPREPILTVRAPAIEAQFIETREFSVEEISRFTGIPKHMLQTGKESYDSNAQQRLNYVTDTLLPYVVQWESEDSYKILSKVQRAGGLYVHGNVEALLRADPTTRADFYVKLIEHSVMNPDDARAKEELDPIPGGLGKRFLVTKALGSLESVLKGEDGNA